MNQVPLIRINNIYSNENIFKEFQTLISKEECEKSKPNLSISQRFIGVAIYMQYVTDINLLRCMFDYIKKLGFLNSSISFGNEIQKLEDILNSIRPISLKSNIISAAFQWEMLVHEYKKNKKIDVPPLKTKINGEFFYNNIDEIEEYLKDKELSIIIDNPDGLNFKQYKKSLIKVKEMMIKSDLEFGFSYYKKQILYLDSFISTLEEDVEVQVETVAKAEAEPVSDANVEMDYHPFKDVKIFKKFKEYVNIRIVKRNPKDLFREFSFICQKMISSGFVYHVQHIEFASCLKEKKIMSKEVYDKVCKTRGFKKSNKKNVKGREDVFNLIFNNK